MSRRRHASVVVAILVATRLSPQCRLLEEKKRNNYADMSARSSSVETDRQLRRSPGNLVPDSRDRPAEPVARSLGQSVARSAKVLFSTLSHLVAVGVSQTRINVSHMIQAWRIQMVSKAIRRT